MDYVIHEEAGCGKVGEIVRGVSKQMKKRCE